ncbi:MAG: hypothetical protein ACOYOP_04380 [Microthrixaceae bacterium]
MDLLAPVAALASVAVAALVAVTSAARVGRAARVLQGASPDVPAATRRLGRQTDRLRGATGRHLGR